MRFLNRFFLLAVVLILSLPPFNAFSEEPVPADGHVVKVGNIIIKQSDINLRAQRIMPMQVSFHGSVTLEKITEIKMLAQQELVDRAYKVQYAIDNEISVDAASIESDWKKRLDKNPQAVASASAAQLSKIKADLYLDMLANKAEVIAVEEKITVSDEDVAAYYKKNEATYLRPKQFTASHIFVKVDPSDNAEEKALKRARAEELLERAKSGEDFYNLAYYESDDRSRYVGGSLGSFHAGQTVPEFDAAIQTMQAGEIIGPVKSMYGFHVIKLDAVEDQRQLKFEEVEGKIRTRLKESEREGLYEQWMSQMKENYPVEVLEQ